MPSIVVNHIELEPQQLHSVKMYINITRNQSYKQCSDKNAAKQIINFMRSVYLMDHPFDELDFAEDLLTESSLVANMVIPTKVNDLSSLIEIAIDFDNMLALNQKNYQRFYFGDGESFTSNQMQLIENKTNAVIRHYAASYTLEKKPVDDLLKIGAEVTELSQDNPLLIVKEKSANSRSKKRKAVCQYTQDGVLLAVFPNVRTASDMTNTDAWFVDSEMLQCTLTAHGHFHLVGVDTVHFGLDIERHQRHVEQSGVERFF